MKIEGTKLREIEKFFVNSLKVVVGKINPLELGRVVHDFTEHTTHVF